MADNALSASEQKNLLVQFEAIEQTRTEGKKVNDYINRIKALAIFYNIE
jgi:uncharacterized protein YdeI (YjbR/CyaY-like superfamily)